MHPVKSLRTLKAAGLILAAVVLGLMTVQGSYALWNATAASNAGTIQAADFNVLVNGNPMPAGSISKLDIAPLNRGTAQYTRIDINNNVNVTAQSPLVLQASLTGLVPVDNFGGKLTVKTAPAAAGTDCSTLAPAAYKTGAPVLPALKVAGSQAVCFKVELAADTQAAYLGKPITIPVTLTVAQVAPAAKQ